MKSSTLWITDGTIAYTTTSVGSNIKAGTYKLPIFGFNTGQYIQFNGQGNYYAVVGTWSGGIIINPPLLNRVIIGESVNVVNNGIYVKIGEGNMTYSEKREIIYVLNRGYLDTRKIGNDIPVDVSLDFTWKFLRSVSDVSIPTIEEALKQIGAASSWTSTSTNICEPYSVNLYLLNTPPCGSEAESIELQDFCWSSLDHDWHGGKVSVKGTCNILTANVTHTS